MNIPRYWISLFLLLLAGLISTRLGVSPYLFFAGYVVLQYVVLATAWNILGGYAGYVNFGVAGFFGIGVYSTVVVTKLGGLPLPLEIAVAALVAGLAGLGMG